MCLSSRYLTENSVFDNAFVILECYTQLYLDTVIANFCGFLDVKNVQMITGNKLSNDRSQGQETFSAPSATMTQSAEATILPNRQKALQFSPSKIELNICQKYIHLYIYIYIYIYIYTYIKYIYI